MPKKKEEPKVEPKVEAVSVAETVAVEANTSNQPEIDFLRDLHKRMSDRGFHSIGDIEVALSNLV